MPNRLPSHGLGLGWLLCGLACAATQPTQEKTPPPPETADAFFPLAVGWRWAFELEKDGETILATTAIVEKTGDTSILRAGEERTAYTASAEGIWRRDGLGTGELVLKNPMRAGTAWALRGGQARVVSVGEAVSVPAGTFPHCATVEEVRSSPDRLLRTIYAPGVGPISIEVQVSDPHTRRFEVVLRARLRGMTRPGEHPLDGPGGGTAP